MKFNKTLIALAAVFFILGAVRIFSQPVLNENSITFENSQTATLVGQDGIIMRTVDGGLSWTEQLSGVTNVLNSIDQTSYTDNTGNPVTLQLAVGDNGILIKSTDAGMSWKLGNSNSVETLNDIIIYSPEMMFISGTNGTLLRSIDFGETWVPFVLSTTKSLNHVAVFSPNTQAATINAVVVGDSGTVFATMNMEDWYSISVPTTENLLSAASMNDILVCAGSNGTILKSTNKGNDWVVSNSGITTSIFDLSFINATTVIGSSENGVMVRSEDIGDNWSVIVTPATVDLFAVNFGTETFGISTGAEGTEIYTTDGGATWFSDMTASSTVNNKKEPVMLSQNYPNPFNPSTIINYTLTGNSNISIKVFDMTGREVRTLVNSYHGAGTYSVNFNAINLSSGIYFYVMRVNNGSNEITKTMRMILTK
ncbi:MAG: T9SS type A sorting domain-containing protein [Ignavibacteria bacterium]